MKKFCLLGVSLLFVEVTCADTYTWRGGADFRFATAENWVVNEAAATAAPGGTDTAELKGLSNSVTVEDGDEVSVMRLDLRGPGYNYNENADHLVINGGSFSLLETEMTDWNAHSVLGWHAGGVLRINDGNVTLGSLYVGGQYGRGWIHIYDGTVTMTGEMRLGGYGGEGIARGWLNVHGGSIDFGNNQLSVGQSGEGTVNQDGGTIQWSEGSVYSSSRLPVIGNNSAARGEFNLASGSVSRPRMQFWGYQDSYFTIGRAGAGVMKVTGTGNFYCNDWLLLADESGSSGTLGLNGGVTAVRTFKGGSGTSSVVLSLSPVGRWTHLACGTRYCGVLSPTVASATWFQNIGSLLVKEGGAVISNDFDVTIDHVLASGATHDGGLVKKGASTLTLSAANTFNGAVVVEMGTLKLGCDNALPSGVTVTVKSGATLDLNGKAVSGAVWGSSDTDVAKVKNGKVTGVAKGSAVISAVYDGTVMECIVSVINKSTSKTARYNVLIMDYMRTSNPRTIIRLASDHSDNFTIMTLVTDVMNTLVTENYEIPLFSLLHELLTYTEDDLRETITEYNNVTKIIEKNKADNGTIAQFKGLSARLAPLMNRKRLASGTLINGVFMTDYHNEGLYDRDPFELLDIVLDDAITEIKDNICLMIYYASNKSHTMSYTPLKQNITRQIVAHMYNYIHHTPLVGLAQGARRKRVMTFLETGTRINILLIIDRVLAGDEGGQAGYQVGDIFDEITAVAKHLTANFTLFRIVLPFVQLVMRRQVLFQSDYVNNVIEYATYWDTHAIDLAAIAPFAYFYSRKGRPDAPSETEWQAWIPKIIEAYKSGDSLSYFAMERLLIIAAMAGYQHVEPIVQALRAGSNRDSEWFDYSQMSFIYVLYQLGLKLPELPQEVEEMLTEWCVDWTLRCRGWFKGRNSYKANPMQLYKRNVMTWYAMVYCVRYGDNRDPEGKSVPAFRDLIRSAVETRDKELLVHLLNNISELVTDSGYIYTSLDLLYSVMEQIPNRQVLEEFETNANPRYPDTKESVINLIGKILGTAKNYFPAQVNAFLTKDIISLSFPGIGDYKDEILGYTPGGERLSDLFTHKFGNALIYTLIHEETIDDVVVQSLQATSTAKDSFEWFESVVKIVFNKMFNLHL